MPPSLHLLHPLYSSFLYYFCIYLTISIVALALVLFCHNSCLASFSWNRPCLLYFCPDWYYNWLVNVNFNSKFFQMIPTNAFLGFPPNFTGIKFFISISLMLMMMMLVILLSIFFLYSVFSIAIFNMLLFPYWVFSCPSILFFYSPLSFPA
jgi:hypothetical protein